MALRWLTLMLLLAQSLSTHFRPKMYLSRNKGGGGYTYTRKYPSYTQLMRKYGAKSENLTKLPKEGLNIYPRLHSNETEVDFSKFITEYYKNHSHFEEIMTASKSENTEQKTGEDGEFLPEMVSDELMADAISFVEASAKAESDCEVCVYVMENKEQHQPYLCRGLKTPSQQQACVSILVSLMWWLENEVYWVNYGCEKSSETKEWSWVKPCPAHAICSFMQSMYDKAPFCPPDKNFRKPKA